jgi:type I restriction enzyme S subunit
MDPRYLWHWLSHVEAELAAKGRGATFPQVSRNDIVEMQLELPPLDEQRGIAAILDKADALRQKRKRAIALLDTLTRSIFLEMFGKGISWPTVSLADAVRPGTIVTYGIVQAGDEFEGGVPYIRTGDIENGRVRLTGLRHTNPAVAARFERSKVLSGDIVMSIRATVGTVALVPPQLDGANLTQGTARIAPGPKTNPTYLLHFLRSDPVQAWIKRQVKGATFLEITLGRLRELSVELPPLDLQLRFASLVSSIEKTLLNATHFGSDLEGLFASLQHQAFSGQL